MKGVGKMKLIIDGQELEALPGDSILDVARREGIFIPTLCYHEAFGGQGNCRLCTVEVTAGQRTRLAAACTYPAAEGIIVRTLTPAVKRLRKNIIMLLYKRAPDSVFIQKLFRDYGCQDNSLEADPQERCILCRLCVLSCAKMGTSAISAVMRGIEKQISTPYEDAATACIGCAACAQICPTEAIEVKEEAGQRTIWNRSFDLVPCEACGHGFATSEQLEHLATRLELPESEVTLCQPCRRKLLAGKMKQYLR